MTIQHKGPISCVAVQPSGDLVATAGYDNQVILWRYGRAIKRVVHDHLANHCVFSPDGRSLLTSSSDYTARMYSLPDLKLVAVFHDHDDDVEMGAFDDAGQLVATASRDGKVRVYTLDGTLRNELHGHTADVISVAWSGDAVISSGDDGTIKWWDLRTNRPAAETDLGGVETDTIAVDDAGRIYAGNDDGEIVIVDGSTRRAVPAHASGIKRLVIDRRNGLLASISYDRTAKVWRTHNGAPEELHTIPLPDIIWPRSCAFRGSNELLFGTFGSLYASYDLDAGEWKLDRIEADPSINAVTISQGHVYTVGDAGVVYQDDDKLRELGSLCNFVRPCGSRLVAGGQAGRLFDAESGSTLFQHRSPLNCMATFDHAGVPHAIVGTYTGEGLVFRLTDDACELVKTIQLHDNAIKGVCTSDKLIFSVCATGGAALHGIGDLLLIRRLLAAHPKIANACVTVRDGVFASVSRDRILRLWDTGLGCTEHETPHEHSIKCMAATADGRFIATGCYGGGVGVFDVREKRYVHFEHPTASGISCLTNGLNEGEFAASSYDGSVYVVSVYKEPTRV